MNSKIYRIYKFKFYLHASHYITFNGERGQTHPHTWEFEIWLAVPRLQSVPFQVYEDAVVSVFDAYRNQVLNHVDPFDKMIPTLENIVEYFGSVIRPVAASIGSTLYMIEGSETPTRSYAIDYSRDDHAQEIITKQSDDVLDDVLDNLLDNIQMKQQGQS